jgi:hypothetical protein
LGDLVALHLKILCFIFLNMFCFSFVTLTFDLAWLHGKQASPQPKVEPPVPKIVSPPQPEKSPAKVDTTAPKVEKPSVPPPPKVDYVIDLFNMLSMDETTEKESESSTNDGNAWDGFQCNHTSMGVAGGERWRRGGARWWRWLGVADEVQSPVVGELHGTLRKPLVVEEEAGSPWVELSTMACGGGGRRSGEVTARSPEKGGSGGVEVGGDVEGGGGIIEGGGGVEGGGGAELGQPDGAKWNFTAIRVSRRRGYSPYTRDIFGIGWIMSADTNNEIYGIGWRNPVDTKDFWPIPTKLSL